MKAYQRKYVSQKGKHKDTKYASGKEQRGEADSLTGGAEGNEWLTSRPEEWEAVSGPHQPCLTWSASPSRANSRDRTGVSPAMLFFSDSGPFSSIRIPTSSARRCTSRRLVHGLRRQQEGWWLHSPWLGSHEIHQNRA